MIIGDCNIINGDCVEIIKTLGCVDAVICDPPYQLVNWTNPHKWDKALNLEEIWRLLQTRTTDRSAILLFGNEPYSTFQRNSNPALFKYDLIWVKNKVTGFMNAKVKPLKTFEKISVFSSGTTAPGRMRNMTYNPQGLTRVDKTVKNTKRSSTVMSDRPSIKEEHTQEFTNYPKDVLEFDCESGLHPTQKPVALMEYLIRTYTNPGDTVLDFTMGSGTTGVACQNTGRKFIGIEKHQKYFEIAVNRLQGNAVKTVFIESGARDKIVEIVGNVK